MAETLRGCGISEEDLTLSHVGRSCSEGSYLLERGSLRGIELIQFGLGVSKLDGSIISLFTRRVVGLHGRRMGIVSRKVLLLGRRELSHRHASGLLGNGKAAVLPSKIGCSILGVGVSALGSFIGFTPHLFSVFQLLPNLEEEVLGAFEVPLGVLQLRGE